MTPDIPFLRVQVQFPSQAGEEPKIEYRDFAVLPRKGELTTSVDVPAESSGPVYRILEVIHFEQPNPAGLVAILMLEPNT